MLCLAPVIEVYAGRIADRCHRALGSRRRGDLSLLLRL